MKDKPKGLFFFGRPHCEKVNKENFNLGVDKLRSIVYTIITEREVNKMTKTEMVNRMIILGCIKESDRGSMMRRDKATVMRLYIRVIPVRIEYLEKEKRG